MFQGQVTNVLTELIFINLKFKIAAGSERTHSLMAWWIYLVLSQTF